MSGAELSSAETYPTPLSRSPDKVRISFTLRDPDSAKQWGSGNCYRRGAYPSIPSVPQCYDVCGVPGWP